MDLVYVELAPQPQLPLADEPYDRWLAPDGRTNAEFRRRADGYLIRFPGQADCTIDLAAQEARCVPASAEMAEVCRNLFRNALMPLASNYAGGLFLHGSAASVAGRGIAFLGPSRRGKTTLAGAFARAGHPFITEDAVALSPGRAGEYLITPSWPVLRLFADSANHLLGSDGASTAADGKMAFSASGNLPFARQSQQLAALYLLGAGDVAQTTISAVPPSLALTEIMQHSFILDVEDRTRLRDHFARLAALTQAVPCFMLDFPRVYSQLPDVVEAVARHKISEPGKL